MNKKSAYLPLVRPWVFWCEIPLTFLLILSIKHNDSITSTPFKLYPLIAVTVLAMIFAIIYFFRVVKISLEEVRAIGVFSSRESAMVNEGKILVLRLENNNAIGISLIGNDGVVPGFDWLKTTGDAPRDISLFRERAYGSYSAVLHTLMALGISIEDAAPLIDSDSSATGECVSATSLMHKDAIEIHITITKTV